MVGPEDSRFGGALLGVVVNRSINAPNVRSRPCLVRFGPLAGIDLVHLDCPACTRSELPLGLFAMAAICPHRWREFKATIS